MRSEEFQVRECEYARSSTACNEDQRSALRQRPELLRTWSGIPPRRLECLLVRDTAESEHGHALQGNFRSVRPSEVEEDGGPGPEAREGRRKHLPFRRRQR